MNQLQRMTWPLHMLGLLSVACCDGSSRSSESEGYIVVQTDCVNWDAYDEDWHRRHCREPIHWCTAPDGGAASGRALDGSACTTVDAGKDASTDGATDATSNTMTSSGGESDGSQASDGSNADAGAPGASCTVSATCASGTSCVVGSCQPCPSGVCICQRDDDCPASQICDHTSTGRADCAPVYGGVNCTNDSGSPCHTGDANCTCATYSFVVCEARSQ
jgi:hypothetical protein